MSVLSTSSETWGEKWEQQLSRLECSSERRASMFLRSYKHLKIAWRIHKQRDWTQVSRVWQSLCVTLCAAGWWREVSHAARLGLCDQVFRDAWWCPMTADLKASGGLHFLPLLFLLLEDSSLDGWMGEKIQGHSGKSRQFHFPSATLVQHQQAFHSLTYFGLYTNYPPQQCVSHISMFQSA